MNCDDLEPLVLEWADGSLPEAERPSVERHLAGCAECRALASEWRSLDATLVRRTQATAPALPTGFDQQVKAMIATATLSDAEQNQRRRKLQAEFESGLASLKGSVWNWEDITRWMAYAGLAAVAGWTLVEFAPALNGALESAGLAAVNPGLLSLLTASVVFVGAGLSIAFAPRLSRG